MRDIFVLLVDDEPSFIEMVKEALKVVSDNQFIIDTASSAQEAIKKLENSRVDVIVSDYSMPEMTGLDLFNSIRDFYKIPFILFTGKDDEKVVIEAINAGVDYFLKKAADHQVLYPKLAHMIRQGAEKRFAEEKIEENERKFKDLFEKSLIATLIYTPNGILTDCNTAALTLFGLISKDDLIGRPVLTYQELTHEQVKTLESGESIRYTTIINFEELTSEISLQSQRKDKIFIDVSFIPQVTSDGDVTAYYVQIVDLTQQYIAKSALRKSNEQLGLAIEGSELGLWDWYLDTGETVFNERWAEIIGYTLDELKPTSIETWIQFSHPDDLAISDEQIKRHIAGEIPFYQCIVRMKHKDGHWVYIQDRGKITEWDDTGRPVRMTGTHIDISESKRVEEELIKITEELDKFFSVTLEMLCIANTDGYFLRINPAWEEALGWTEEELLSKQFLDFVHPDDINATLAAIADLSNQKNVIHFENRYLTKEGSYRWIDWRSVPVHNIIYAAAQDITDRKINEELLEKKRKILDSISYAATVLMSSLSDESITDVIGRLGMAVGASRAYIFIHHLSEEGESLISHRYEWVFEGVTPQVNNPNLHNLRWKDKGYSRWASILLNKGIISGSIKDFPKEEHRLLTEQDIISLAVVPIFSHDDFHGFIGFDNCYTEHEWTKAELETLEAAAGLLGASFGRMKADIEVQIREKNLSTFFNTIDDFLFVLSQDGMIEQVNETVIERLGYSEEELVGKSVIMIHPDEMQENASDIITSMIQGTCDYCPIPLKTRDGTHIPVETRIVPGEWNGHPALFGVSKDISAITLSEEKFSKAFHSSGTLMCISTMEGEFIDVNRKFLETLGYTREDVIGKTVNEVELFVDNSDLDTIYKDLIEKGNCRINKINIKTRDKQVLNGTYAADVIHIQNTKVVLSVLHDVTAIIRLSEALLQANTKLNLLSSITRHDILNQVQVLFFVEDFFRRKITPDNPMSEELEMFSKTVDTIHRQILFTRNYQDMGVKAPDWERVEKVFNEIKRDKLFQDLTVESKTGDLEIFTDPMFSKVCFNLLENSLRHGEGVTEILVSFIEREGKGLLLYEDNGAGVDPAIKSKIFKRGFGKNTGLGLFLTAEILSITGITIQETGEPGRGARFEIEIPAGCYRFGSIS